MACVDHKYLFINDLRRIFVVGSVIVALSGSSSASRTHHRDSDDTPHHRVARTSFANVLAHPTLWSHLSPRVPRGLALSHNSDGTLAPSAFLDYLLYRRALNPARFDHYHPTIGPQLSTQLPALPTVTVPPITPPAPQIVPPPLTPPARQTVPEPSTLLLGTAMIAGVGYMRRRQARMS
jgi:hypothetical protein